MTLPTDSQARKDTPVWSGFVVYFPNGIVAVAQLSKWCDRKHNPDKPLDAAPTWAKEKSTDEADAGMRHAMEPLTIGGSEYDPEDGFAHKVKKAWRAMAELERFLLAGNVARAFTPGPGGIRIPCAGATLLEQVLAAYSWKTDAQPFGEPEFAVCNECNYIAPDHYPNCSKNFVRPAQPEVTLYQTPGHGEVKPAVVCTQCGADLEQGLHDPTCLSAAANPHG